MYLISDSRPTQDDVTKYINVVKNSRDQVLSKREATKMRKTQDELVTTYTYTKEDIERNVKERKKTGAAANMGSEQARANLAVQSARAVVSEAKSRLEEAKRELLEMTGETTYEEEKKVDELDKELEKAKNELNERLEEQNTIQDLVSKRKRKLTNRRKDVNWAKVNQRARQMNETADFEAFKEQQARKEAENNSGGQAKFNPFARRKVKPKILWEVGQKEEKKDDEPNENISNANANDNQNGQRKTAALKAAQEAKKVALVAESHQITLDGDGEDFDNNPSFGLASKKKSITRIRKGISLSDYLDRKATGSL
mmetsp:Transcript_8457/g.13046  ORF Transcript_8457/g.13046 Transcript_8457/m.13046 type:complete len:313 (-) Transcript_8457:73-1011(-)